MSRRASNYFLGCLIVMVILVLAATTVSAQDIIEVSRIGEAANSPEAPTAIVVQSLEVERSPIEWVIMLQGAALLFMVTLFGVNAPLRQRVVARVRRSTHLHADDDYPV